MNHSTRQGFWISAQLTLRWITPCWGPSCATQHVWLHPGLHPPDASSTPTPLPGVTAKNVSR